MNFTHSKMFISRGLRYAKDRVRGFTLIELSLVLVLSGVFVAGSVSYYRSSSQTAAVREEIQNMQAISAGIRSLFPGSTTFPDISEQVLISANKVPSSMIDGNALKHAWGGKVSVAAPLAGPGFSSMYYGIPKNACVEFSSGISRNARTVTVSRTFVKRDDESFNSTLAQSACSASNGALNVKVESD